MVGRRAWPVLEQADRPYSSSEYFYPFVWIFMSISNIYFVFVITVIKCFNELIINIYKIHSLSFYVLTNTLPSKPNRYAIMVLKCWIIDMFKVRKLIYTLDFQLGLYIYYFFLGRPLGWPNWERATERQCLGETCFLAM